VRLRAVVADEEPKSVCTSFFHIPGHLTAAQFSFNLRWQVIVLQDFDLILLSFSQSLGYLPVSDSFSLFSRT